MKDFIKRGLIISITGVLLVYFVYLFVQGKVIVNSKYLQRNTLYYFVLMIISLYVMVLYGIYPFHIRFSKPLLFFMGIALIIISKAVLQNNGEEGVFVGDIISVLGVVLTLLSRTKVLISNKVLKKRADEKIEVIEV